MSTTRTENAAPSRTLLRSVVLHEIATQLRRFSAGHDVPGADSEHVHCLRSLADSREIIAAAKHAHRAVVIARAADAIECDDSAAIDALTRYRVRHDGGVLRGTRHPEARERRKLAQTVDGETTLLQALAGIRLAEDGTAQRVRIDFAGAGPRGDQTP